VIPIWGHLDEPDRAKFQVVVSFLKGRLMETATLKWALGLKPNQNIERLAVIDALNSRGDQGLNEPWNKAWRLIEEAWRDSRDDGDHDLSVYDVQRRLQSGDRSGSLIFQIANLVTPRLKVEITSDVSWASKRKPRRKSEPSDSLRTQLESGKLVSLELLELGAIQEEAFFLELANALDAALLRGLDIAKRAGCYVGGLNRVYYCSGGEEDGDPDAYHTGIGPCVKLLHAVVARIVELSPKSAKSIVDGWRFLPSPIHQRLWAALARNPALIPSEAIWPFLDELDAQQFWDVDGLPELVELRAKRFVDLDDAARSTILSLIRKGPPRRNWYRAPSGEALKTAKRYCTARELKRLSLEGVALPAEFDQALQDGVIEFPEIAEMTVKNSIPHGIRLHTREANPDPQYDELSGVQRLKALEASLNAARSWEDDPGTRAGDWIRLAGNTGHLLADFETLEDGGDSFPQVWQRFAWAHVSGGEHSQRILNLIERLSDKTVTVAIDAITHWFSCQDKAVVGSEIGLRIWNRLWPLAVGITNEKVRENSEPSLETALRADEDDAKTTKLDTLNNPVGRLVGNFLSQCPSLEADHNGKWPDGPARDMRDIIMEVDGQSKLITRHRLIEGIGYFLKADPDWTKQQLIYPLQSDDKEALILWQAAARRTLFMGALGYIGDEVVKRVADSRLPRETRKSLLFSLTVEAMHAFREKRQPAVPNVRLQQLLRTVEESLRSSAANSVQKYVRDVDNEEPRALIFTTAAKPFLQQVWPQERSLTSRSVSAAFADLPATAGESFCDAVETIARFLVPFDCWSMLDYGLYGADKLQAINTAEMASELLKLLDLTVGQAQSSVIPHDLSEALSTIDAVMPALRVDPRYRRLAAAARR
jgi:hypothetical protein